MKNKIILLALLFVSINGWSQIFNLTGKPIAGTIIPDSGTVRAGWMQSGDILVSHNKTDTVRCVLLLCDTGRYLNRMESNSNWATINPIVYWQFGYSVTKRVYEYFRSISYLDVDKKPLSKNIVVWQSQLLK